MLNFGKWMFIEFMLVSILSLKEKEGEFSPLDILPCSTRKRFIYNEV